tara:strand:+ start:58 stop:546 length:489 start_codon:yes stop_codon:yes gene_type:complete
LAPKLAIAAAVGAAAFTVSNQIAAAKTQQAAYNFNAAIADRNAKVKEQDLEVFRRSHDLKMRRFTRDFRKLNDATLMAYSSRGIAMEGTPLLVAMENAAEFEEEKAILNFNAKVKEQSIQESAVNERLRGSLQRLYGKAAMKSGYAQAGATLLQAGARIGSA